MSNRDKAAEIIAPWIEKERGHPDDNAESAAGALAAAGVLAPEMREEWGAEVEGKIPGTWYQLNQHGIAPDHYADASWLETREEAESLMEDVMAGEWYENARLVRRYVTQHEVIDGE